MIIYNTMVWPNANSYYLSGPFELKIRKSLILDLRNSSYAERVLEPLMKQREVRCSKPKT